MKTKIENTLSKLTLLSTRFLITQNLCKRIGNVSINFAVKKGKKIPRNYPFGVMPQHLTAGVNALTAAYLLVIIRDSAVKVKRFYNENEN